MRLEWGGTRRGRRASALGATLMVGLAVLMGVVAGCHQADPVASLKERVSAYWGLKQAKSWDEVYEKFIDPETKKTVTKDAFLKRRWLAFDILSYEISDVQQAGDKATVTVSNEANFPLKTPGGELQFIKKQVSTKDDWVQRDGTWYVVLSE
jgi:hypothetical protein